MKIGNIVISRKLILSFTMICLVISAVVGYSYVNTDLGSTANLTVKGQGVRGECNQANFYDRISCLSTLDSKSSEFVSDKVGINFRADSSATNGLGIYTLSTTIDEQYPVHYYRGRVDDNYVKLGGYCWRAVRTTATGGVKLVYNGTQHYEYETEILGRDSYNETNDATYPFTFDVSTKQWASNVPHTAYASDSITFTLDSPTSSGQYFINYKVSTGSEDYAYFYKDGVQIGSYNNSQSGSIDLGSVTAATEFTVTYTRGSSNNSWSGDDKVYFTVSHVGENQVYTCENSGSNAVIADEGYSDSYYSPAYSGYMSGVYYKTTSDYSPNSKGYTYAKSFTYDNGKYHLVDTKTTFDPYYHYICLDGSDECTVAQYIYQGYISGSSLSSINYIELKDGKDIQEVLTEAYQNNTDSTIKAAIDSWFLNTFAPNFVSDGKTYDDYLEDTVWCNDRSENGIGYDYYITNGWNPESSYQSGNGHNILHYGAFGRVQYGIPRVDCPNKNDSFTVNDLTNGNGALTYPIALLTADELMLSGLSSGSNRTNNSYLSINKDWWTMSLETYEGCPYPYLYQPDGYFHTQRPDHDMGVRPAISLKHSINIASGDGTATNPYVVE